MTLPVVYIWNLCDFSSDIVYRVRGVALSCGRLVYCVWVSRDPEEMGEGGRHCGGNLTLTSSLNSTVDNSLGQVKIRVPTIKAHSGK